MDKEITDLEIFGQYVMARKLKFSINNGYRSLKLEMSPQAVPIILKDRNAADYMNGFNNSKTAFSEYLKKDPELANMIDELQDLIKQIEVYCKMNDFTPEFVLHLGAIVNFEK